jgi:hypothetical protein
MKLLILLAISILFNEDAYCEPYKSKTFPSRSVIEKNYKYIANENYGITDIVGKYIDGNDVYIAYFKIQHKERNIREMIVIKFIHLDTDLWLMINKENNNTTVLEK